MKLILCFVLFLCWVEIYGQRSRTNQDASKESQAPTRSRGKSRFSATEEFAQLSEEPARTTSNRRASTRTRIHSNNPKAAADRRSRPTEAPKTYSIEEINNDSPIDSFVRRSKPRVLSESRFEVSSPRTQTFEASSPLVDVEEIGFGSTARAILQSRGETPPPKTTTPVVDEQYLLTNFGSTIRSLAAASKSAQSGFLSQRPSLLRSEAPILNADDIPSRRSSIRAEPLPSLRGSEVTSAPVRSRSRTSRPKPEPPITDRPIVEDYVPVETEEPLIADGLEVATEADFGDVVLPAGEEVKTAPPPPSTTTTKRPGRRNGSRSRVFEEVDNAVTARSRSRTRPSEVPRQRAAPRRKVDDTLGAESIYRGPSVFTANEQNSKPRPGRKIDSKFEKVPVSISDVPISRGIRQGVRRFETTTTASSITPSTSRTVKGRGNIRSRAARPTAAEPTAIPSRRNESARRAPVASNSNRQESSTTQASSRRRGGRFQVAESTTQTVRSTAKTSRSSQRFRSRQPDMPPNIDESKLEVLPLFERESKTLVSSPVIKPKSRSFTNRRSGIDHMHVSATENDVKFVEKPTTNGVTRVSVTKTESVQSSTVTTPLVSSVSPPIVKESVVAEVNQVISKSTITRRKKVPKAKAAEILSRGTKKAEIKFTDVGKKKKSSEEEIGEDDNYPAPFKALIQSKKNKEEPKSGSFTTTTSAPASTAKAIVTSSTASPRTSSFLTRAITTLPSRKPKKLNGAITETDNELDSKSTTTARPVRAKFSEKPKIGRQKEKWPLKPSTVRPSLEKLKTSATPRKIYTTREYSDHHSRRKALRSTASPPSTTPFSSINEAKFSAKFMEKEANEAKKSKLDVLSQDTKSAFIKKPTSNFSRYSSRYRSDTSTRSTVLKATTIAPFYIPTIPTPAYVPTVPTITPPAPSVEDGIEAVKDRDLGVEVISFDDPVNTIPSADLVNGEFLTTDRNLKMSPTVKDGMTEKPVSIIERIINSITMISTTAAPSSAAIPVTTEANGNSAILKLASKKPTTSNDKTKPDVRTNIIETITSEKPTTIIEKIRSSLSAIQTNEVGTDLEPSSTTPLSIVTTKYSAKFRGGSVGTAELPAPLPLSTSVNPLSVLDQIGENQVIEQKTIGKLLDILNGLVSTPSSSEAPDNLVVVTPKSFGGFVSTTFSPQEPIEAITVSDLITTPVYISSSVNTAATTDVPSTTLLSEAETLTSTDSITTTTELPSTTTQESSTDVLSSTQTTLLNIPFQVESNKMARVLQTERRYTSTPRVVITSTTSSPPSSTIATSIPSTTLPLSTTMQTSSTENVVEIMAVPGETRISKSQTTSANIETSTVPLSTTEDSTLLVSSSTISQSTETIPPALGEILNGRTVEALNMLIKPQPTPNFKTLKVNQNSIVSSSTDSTSTTGKEAPLFTSPLSTTSEVSPTQSTTSKRFLSTTTLPPSTTTKIPSTITTKRIESTTAVASTSLPPRTTSTMEVPTFTPASIFPTILTTLFPNLLKVTTPKSRIYSTSSPEFSNSIGNRFEELTAAGTTARPTIVLSQTPTSQRISTTTPRTTTTVFTTTSEPATTTTATTTTTKTTTTTTTTTPKPTTRRTTQAAKLTSASKEETDKIFNQLKKNGKFNNLNEEQRRNLQEIEKIEQEQAELLKQINLLTKMFGGANARAPNLPPIANPLAGGTANNLANRIIAMAVERDKSHATETAAPPTTTRRTTTQKTTTERPTSKRPNSIQDKLLLTDLEDSTKKTTPSLEDVLRQYNLNGLTTNTPLTSTYGKTDEAVLAAILKEHGIGPTTPKVLGEKVKEAGIFEEIPVTKKPKPKSRAVGTTARPIGGRLMQGLNWLLDILDPPTTKKPSSARKNKAKVPSKEIGADEELLTNQPTRITPMVTAAPVTKPSLSQEEIQVLIKQLEAVQNNPNAADQLDFSKITSLHNLINVNEGVQVTHAGQHGATSRATPRPQRTTTASPIVAEIPIRPRFSTVSTVSVSNSIDDLELDVTTPRPRPLPPVSLNPIPGIDDQGDSMVRSNLLTAAVNVTRAISSFLGSAIQDAAQQVRSVFYTGTSGVLSSLSSGSGVPSIAGASSSSRVN
ncbi:mucin-2-like isoform X4 [Euwallacea similis]|uniref:mucin-2-like isoform X4 n=1 Tax=Euwallacea similis TaxID=1736056 RepID=UPI00344D4B8C